MCCDKLAARAGAAGDDRADTDASVHGVLRPPLQDSDHQCWREDLQDSGTGLLFLVADARRLAGVRHSAVA